MNELRPFLIPIKGLKLGKHVFQLQLNKAFFQAIDSSSEVVGNFDVQLILEKKYGMFDLEFQVNGKLFTNCDRCLEPIHLPISDNYRLIVKKGDGDDDLDVVFVDDFDDYLDVSKYLYDYTLLSIPLIKVIDGCESMNPSPCNEEILDKMDSEDLDEPSKDIWKELKNIDFKN